MRARYARSDPVLQQNNHHDEREQKALRLKERGNISCRQAPT